MAAAVSGRHWAVRSAAIAGAGIVLASCGLTGPNNSSSSKSRTTTTVKKTAGTNFPTVPYLATTTSTTQAPAPLGTNTGGQTTGPVDTPTSYVVKSGDIAVLIARRYSITLSELAAANPDKNMDRLQPGDQLVIPPPSPGSNPTPTIASPTGTTRAPSGTTTAAPKSGATYTVVAGDTLVGIAKKVGSSVATLQQLNPGVTANLQVGQKLNIPKATAPAATTTTKKP